MHACEWLGASGCVCVIYNGSRICTLLCCFVPLLFIISPPPLTGFSGLNTPLRSSPTQTHTHTHTILKTILFLFGSPPPSVHAPSAPKDASVVAAGSNEHGIVHRRGLTLPPVCPIPDLRGDDIDSAGTSASTLNRQPFQGPCPCILRVCALLFSMCSRWVRVCVCFVICVVSFNAPVSVVLLLVVCLMLLLLLLMLSSTRTLTHTHTLRSHERAFSPTHPPYSRRCFLCLFRFYVACLFGLLSGL